MAFTWNQDINEGSPIEDDDMNEIQDNLDEIANDINISGFCWSDNSGEYSTPMPVSTGDLIDNQTIQQLQDGTDYMDDNKHNSVYSGENATVYDGENSTYESNNYSYCDTNLDVDNDGHDGTVNSGYCSGVSCDGVA